jgi:hypothetical protein
METLEFGYLLMRRRPRLQALANWLAPNEPRARAAVEKAIAQAWRSRERIATEADIDPNLRSWFRAAMAEAWSAPCGEGACGLGDRREGGR